ncbi:MAG: ComF family protein [Akkermansiaceae bacterium]
MIFKNLKLLDFIYPSTCHLCGAGLQGTRYLCTACCESFTPVEAPLCAQCGECFDGQIDDTFICPNCHQLSFAFSFARAAYQGKAHALELVHDYKYLRQIHLSREIGHLCASALDDPRFSPYLKNGILIPVPLHWRRYKKRHFNQSHEIALCVARSKPSLKVLSALKRNRHTETQTTFSRAKRLRNLKDAFTLKKRYHETIQDQHVILVDDVFTTGATANECSKTLIQAGAASVAVLTFLRG